MSVIKPTYDVDFYRHKKTGHIYSVISWDIVNATNSDDGKHMVLYFRNGLFFVRELKEFNLKFEHVETLL